MQHIHMCYKCTIRSACPLGMEFECAMEASLQLYGVMLKVCQPTFESTPVLRLHGSYRYMAVYTYTSMLPVS